MSVVQQDADALDFSCLATPVARGLRGLQARWVDRIKRAALVRLHHSRRGERLLLRMYLVGEDATERALLDELMPQSPEWLDRQIERHLADERRHVALFADALRRAGDDGTGRMEPDWLSRRKIQRWRRLSHAYAGHFSHGCWCLPSPRGCVPSRWPNACWPATVT